MKYIVSSTFILLSIVLPNLALAYIGPGAGLSAIGSALALVGAILLGVIGFVWYPLKRMLRKRRPLQKEKCDDIDADPSYSEKRTKPISGESPGGLDN